MRVLQKCLLFASTALLLGGCFEIAEEQITDYHANGAKKTSIWVFENGEILKRAEWYGDGIKEYEIPYEDNLPHGKFKRWNDLGDVVLEGFYKKGEKDGKWTYYHPGKKLKAKHVYKNDHPIDKWEGWHGNGQKGYEEFYNDNGDSIGTWKRWFENGVLAEENSCHRLNMEGFQKTYRSNGTLEFKGECKQGTMNGRKVRYYSDGQKIQWEEKFERDSFFGLPDTNTILRTFYYGNGKVQKEEQWDGYVRKGVWKWFDSEGNLLKESKVEYDTLDMHNIIEDQRTDYGICGNTVNDTLVQYIVCAESTFSSRTNSWKLHGKVWYYKRGHKLRYEELWEYGRLQESRSFYIDSLDGNPEGGILASQGFWSFDSKDQQDKRNGSWRNWFRNGVLKDSLTYVNGERNGHQFSYDSTGKLIMHKEQAGKNYPVIVHPVKQE